MSLDNYIKRYTSGHSASRKMQEMYDNADDYTYEEFGEQLDKAKYRPSKKDDNVGGNSMEYQKLLDRYDDNEERANQEFDGTMGAYRANKAQAMVDFLAKKKPKEVEKPVAAPEPKKEEPEKKKGPVEYSDEIKQAISRVKNYESPFGGSNASSEDRGFNSFGYGSPQDKGAKSVTPLPQVMPDGEGQMAPEKEDKRLPKVDPQSFLDKYKMDFKMKPAVNDVSVGA